MNLSEKDKKDMLVEFWLEGGSTPTGLTLERLKQYSFEEMEQDHQWVQWAFPTQTRSKFNPNAPVLDNFTALELIDSDSFGDDYDQIVNNFLQYMFVGPFIDYESWLINGEHNKLRMTRLLESLTLLGKVGNARALVRTIFNAYMGQDEHKDITPENMLYFLKALESKFE